MSLEQITTPKLELEDSIKDDTSGEKSRSQSESNVPAAPSVIPKTEVGTPGTSVTDVSIPIVRSILIPLDGSEHCKRAFKWYIRQMMKPGDRLVFLQIIPPMQHYATNGFAFEQYTDMTNPMKLSVDRAKHTANKYRERAKLHGVTQVKAYIHIHPSPGEALTAAVPEYGIDTVVMGNRGLGTLRRTFMGSVSDYVLHHSRIPVVVIPPEK